MKVDLLIKNGHIIDPSRGVDEIGDIAVVRGKIADISGEKTDAQREIDASGCIVCPGLINYHGHINYMAADIATHPDMTHIPTGVTAAVDCGCTGVANCRAFLNVIQNYLLKVRIYINVSPLGQSTSQFTEELSPESWSDDQFMRAFEYGGERILGLKMRVSRKIVKEKGMRSFEEGLKASERFKKPVLIHPTDPTVPQAEVLSALRGGDVFCHTYMGRGHTIVVDGKVCREAGEAKKRGVLFDVAHGRTNFSWKVAEGAFREGFYPQLIGTDTTSKTWNYAPIFNLPAVMSKILHLGMPLNDVIACVTSNAAGAMNWQHEIGTLEAGTVADIAILKIREGVFPLIDSEGECRTLDKLITPQCVVCNGEIMFRDPLFYEGFSIK